MKLWLRPKDRPTWLGRWGIPSLVLILAFGLRLFRLGDANLWWDEALAVWAVRKGLLGVTLWTAGDVHPPLFFWFLWAWVQLVGEGEFAVRLLSVVFGVLTVAVAYSLGSMLAGRTMGSLAGLLTGLARFHVWWSRPSSMARKSCACTSSRACWVRFRSIVSCVGSAQNALIAMLPPLPPE